MLQYFVPDKKGITQADVVALGLSHAFNTPPKCREVLNSPFGKGVVCCDSSAGTPEMNPKEQTWEDVPGKSWKIGIPKSGAVNPDSLFRGDGPTAHYEYQFSDGLKWRVPLVRDASGASPLPMIRKLSHDGSIAKKPARKFRELYLMGDELFDVANTGAHVSDMRKIEIAVSALSSIYRVSIAEISIFEMLSDVDASMTCALMIDMPSLLQMDGWKQKMEAFMQSDEEFNGRAK